MAYCYKAHGEEEAKFVHRTKLADDLLETNHSPREVKGEVGLTRCLSLLIGSMIGSGIFVAPKGVAEKSGSASLSLLVWAGSGTLSLLAGVCYAELGSTLAGAEHAYFMEAFGPLPAFLFAWLSCLLLKPATLAIVCLSLGELLVEPLTCGCPPSQILVKMLSALSIAVITLMNCYRQTTVSVFQRTLTLVKISALLFIGIVGIIRVLEGQTLYLSSGFKGSATSVPEMASAFYHALWAYEGWNNLNYITEEIQKPKISLMRSTLIGVPLVTVLYLLVNISYLTVLSAAEVASSEATAMTWASRELGSWSFVVTLLVVICALGAGSSASSTAGRLSYVAAREGHLAEMLSYVHLRHLTPLPALIFNGVVATCLVVASSTSSLIHVFGFAAWLLYGLSMLALLLMRYSKPDLQRPFKVPVVLPPTVLLASAYLVIAPLVDNPRMEYLYVTLLLALGLLLYIPMMHCKSWPLKGKATSLLRLLLQVEPRE